MQAAFPSAFIRAEPNDCAPALGQLLFGERVGVHTEAGQWVKGVALRDGCEGWIELCALAPPSVPTHWLCVPSSHAFNDDGEHSRTLFLNSLISADRVEEGFVLAATAGWIAEDDLLPVGMVSAAEPAAIALKFETQSFCIGGRDGPLGLDDVGLVQQVLFAVGRAAPRSRAALTQVGRPLAPGDRPARSDLAIWNDHIGLLVSEDQVVHADPHAGWVWIDRLTEVTARWGAQPRFRRL